MLSPIYEIKKFAKRGRNHYSDFLPEETLFDAKNVSNLKSESFEGRFERPISSVYFYILTIGVFVLFSVFSYKLYSLQIINHDLYVDKANNNRFKTLPIFARRGAILDKNGIPLAYNTVPINAATSSNGQIVYYREYIDEPGFANLLGYLSYPKADAKGVYWQDEYIGRDGLEKQYNDLLQGITGSRVVEVSASGELTNTEIMNAESNGQNLKTNIDSRIQSIMYKKIKSYCDQYGYKSGAGVWMDANTGEVQALVSYPEYDNNLITNGTTTDDKAKVAMQLQDKSKMHLNRPVSGLFAPGSVVKPFMLYAALKEKVIGEYTQIFSSGKLVIPNRFGGPDTVFRDWKPHGLTDARKAIQESSDEYFYQVGGGYKDQPGLGIDRIYTYMTNFGFGEETGVDMPNEKPGVVPSREWKKENFENGEWLLGNTYHTAIGQYGFQTSPLELARSIAAIANGGKFVTPRVYGSTTTARSIDLDAGYLKVVHEGMRMAAGPSGTAVAISNLNLSLAAKTGTAELGYDNARVNSWITGYMPYENPKYVFVFMLESGSRDNKRGSSYAMKEVLEWMKDNAPEYLTIKE